MTAKKKSIFPTKAYTTTIAQKDESSKSSIIGNVANTVVQGISFGAGSEIGHRTVSAVSSSIFSVEKTDPSSCSKWMDQFKECMNSKNIEECEHLLHKYKDCANNTDCNSNNLFT
jgi:hypothetical protein